MFIIMAIEVVLDLYDGLGYDHYNDHNAAAAAGDDDEDDDSHD